MWIRASLAGFTFARHPKPLGWYACRPDSLSSSDTRMLSGILRVFAKTRPALPAESPERAILEQQVARFEMELLAAEARDSLTAAMRARPQRTWRRCTRAAAAGPASAPRALAPGWRWPRWRVGGVSHCRARARRERARSLTGRAGPCARDVLRTRAPSIDQRIGHRSARGACSLTSGTRCTRPCSSRSPTASNATRASRCITPRSGRRAGGRARRKRRIASSPIAQAAWRRWDLYLSADPWTRPALRRCARYANVFHGVAGKYDLDNPAHLPIAFHQFDRVLFINRDRMERYVSSGLVSRDRAMLVGFPEGRSAGQRRVRRRRHPRARSTSTRTGRPCCTRRPGRRHRRWTSPARTSSPRSPTPAGT